jgi:hypothetical protein
MREKSKKAGQFSGQTCTSFATPAAMTAAMKAFAGAAAFA